VQRLLKGDMTDVIHLPSIAGTPAPRAPSIIA
jgi:hypothetical protein